MPDHSLFNLEGSSVLVTGGGQGIGRSLALGMAKSGADVAILEINPKTGENVAHELETIGVRSMALAGDVTNEDSANRAVRAVVDSWGKLDVLVNNAGVAILGAAEETTLSDFKHVYELDVFGTFICSKAAFAPMAAQKQGSIINIASMCGLTVLVPQKHASYNSAKAAVIMLTKSLSVEWAPHGIRVNAIAPGYVCTPPVEQLQRDDPERWTFWMSKVPMGRAANPTELQGTALFLASRASSYVTGSVVVVDGGHTCM
jgi:NAD(P)-dependent dehydrogenase (short-subunit alcohol dehydrogenase family)